MISAICNIDALINSNDEIGVQRLTGFYGNPETHKRIQSWELLKCLGQQIDKPQVCIGDFNEILSVNEKEGGQGVGWTSLVEKLRILEIVQKIWG